MSEEFLGLVAILCLFGFPLAIFVLGMRHKLERERLKCQGSAEEAQILDQLVRQADRMERRMDNLETILERPGAAQPKIG